jgi:hypothetical protein
MGDDHTQDSAFQQSDMLTPLSLCRNGRNVKDPGQIRASPCNSRLDTRRTKFFFIELVSRQNAAASGVTNELRLHPRSSLRQTRQA